MLLFAASTKVCLPQFWSGQRSLVEVATRRSEGLIHFYCVLHVCCQCISIYLYSSDEIRCISADMIVPMNIYLFQLLETILTCFGCSSILLFLALELLLNHGCYYLIPWVSLLSWTSILHGVSLFDSL